MGFKSHVGLLASLITTLLVVSYVVWIAIRSDVSLQRDHVIVDSSIITLPLPRKLSNMSVEEAILLRRSIREYTSDPVKLEHLAMILWAAYGVTDPVWGFRASPSAGATYPLEVYVVIGEWGVLVEKEGYLTPGVYKYDVHRHLLLLVKSGDVRGELADAALGQEWVRNTPVSLVVCAVFERTTQRYGERGRVRYVPMEAGHLGQNVYLMSTALGYGSVVIGAFIDDRVQSIIGVRQDEIPLYIIPIGVPREQRRIDFTDIWRYIEVKRSG